jgi:hypothetical protein
MKHHFATAGLLLAAILSYMLGWSGGGMLFLAVGVTLEIWFWVRVGRRKARPRNT